jgi:hypothetical protein
LTVCSLSFVVAVVAVVAGGNGCGAAFESGAGAGAATEGAASGGGGSTATSSQESATVNAATSSASAGVGGAGGVGGVGGASTGTGGGGGALPCEQGPACMTGTYCDHESHACTSCDDWSHVAFSSPVVFSVPTTQTIRYPRIGAAFELWFADDDAAPGGLAVAPFNGNMASPSWGTPVPATVTAAAMGVSQLSAPAPIADANGIQYLDGNLSPTNVLVFDAFEASRGGRYLWAGNFTANLSGGVIANAREISALSSFALSNFSYSPVRRFAFVVHGGSTALIKGGSSNPTPEDETVLLTSQCPVQGDFSPWLTTTGDVLFVTEGTTCSNDASIAAGGLYYQRVASDGSLMGMASRVAFAGASGPMAVKHASVTPDSCQLVFESPSAGQFFAATRQ